MKIIPAIQLPTLGIGKVPDNGIGREESSLRSFKQGQCVEG
jgi:hypothetical protein